MVTFATDKETQELITSSRRGIDSIPLVAIGQLGHVNQRVMVQSNSTLLLQLLRTFALCHRTKKKKKNTN